MTQKKPDFILLGTTATLVIFGILALSSASASNSQEKFGTTYYFLTHQILFGIIPGIIFGYLAYRINLNSVKKWIPLILLLNIILLGMVFLPGIGIKAGGAARWLNLGIISVQPSEFLKLNFILYLALWLSSKAERNNLKIKKISNAFSQTFVAFLMIIGTIGLLLFLQPDVSTFGIIILTAVVMYFLANTPIIHTGLLFLMGAAGLVCLAPLASYRMKRILVWIKPETDPMGIGYQAKQALIAVGSGGIFGVGLGMSRQKFGFLPESMTDSIFAVMAEEMGFAGCFILIALFLTFFWRGFKIGKGSQDKFLQLASFGISFWIITQALINISSMIRLFPLTGIPLPFFSYGGTAIFVELIGVGILLNISKKKT